MARPCSNSFQLATHEHVSHPHLQFSLCAHFGLHCATHPIACRHHYCRTSNPAATLPCPPAHLPPHFLFHLRDCLKLPQPISLMALSAGARVRTANKTISIWRDLLPVFNCAVENAFPFRDVLHGKRSNSWWVLPPIIDTLAEASSRFPSDFPELFVSLQPRARELRKSKTMQGFVSNAFNDVCNSLDFAKELARRIKRWFPIDVHGGLHACTHPLIACMLTLSPHNRMCVVKTLCNGWTTSYRAHQHVL
jgi:hypothetical protein